MCPREDETFRATRYGGHPPACTCVACCEKRRAGMSTGGRTKASGTPVWFWMIIGVVIAAVLLALVLR